MNELCWCGSGKEYADCHKAVEDRIAEAKAKGDEVPDRSMIKTPEQIAGIRESAKINTGVLDEVAKYIKAGMTTLDIDRIVYDYTIAHGAIPAPLGYEGFPKSCCTSVNDEVCHGIPSEHVVLKSGDIINVDVSTIYKGYYSDASRMFIVGKPKKDAKELVDITKQCLKLGVEAAKPYGHLGDIGAAIANYAHKHGYSVVEEFGGHGVGVEFHEDPFVPHYGKRNTGILLVPGMIFTIEPMINQGRKGVCIDDENGWTVYTIDGKLSAQWEYTVLMTEKGPEILTY